MESGAPLRSHRECSGRGRHCHPVLDIFRGSCALESHRSCYHLRSDGHGHSRRRASFHQARLRVRRSPGAGGRIRNAGPFVHRGRPSDRPVQLPLALERGIGLGCIPEEVAVFDGAQHCIHCHLSMGMGDEVPRSRQHSPGARHFPGLSDSELRSAGVGREEEFGGRRDFAFRANVRHQRRVAAALWALHGGRACLRKPLLVVIHFPLPGGRGTGGNRIETRPGVAPSGRGNINRPDLLYLAASLLRQQRVARDSRNHRGLCAVLSGHRIRPSRL